MPSVILKENFGENCNEGVFTFSSSASLLVHKKKTGKPKLARSMSFAAGYSQSPSLSCMSNRTTYQKSIATEVKSSSDAPMWAFTGYSRMIRDVS